MIGVWQGGSWASLHELTFTPDRRYRRLWLRNVYGDIVTRGTWQVSGSQLTMKEDFHHSRHRGTFLARVWADLTQARTDRVEVVAPDELHIIRSNGSVSSYSRRPTERPEPERTRSRVP